jgi:hypothetical protein
LDGAVRAFLWSGANSVRARARAAIQLADELEMVLKTPNTSPIIVAHSGGNVVLCALKHLKCGKNRIRFIALATPFIRVYLNTSPLHLSAYLIEAFVFGMALPFALTAYITIKFFPHLDIGIDVLISSLVVTTSSLVVGWFFIPHRE